MFQIFRAIEATVHFQTEMRAEGNSSLRLVWAQKYTGRSLDSLRASLHTDAVRREEIRRRAAKKQRR
jgi:hypothetical protein